MSKEQNRGKRRVTLRRIAGVMALGVACVLPLMQTSVAHAAGDPYWVGVTGPLSGQDAQYGE